MRERADRGGRQAFTLVELLVIIGIITILTGLVLGVGGALRARAARDNTYTLIRSIEGALEQYRDTFGDWPSEGVIGTNPSATDYVWLADLLRTMDAVEPGQVENDVVVDAWRRPIHVIRGGHNRPGLDIWSDGPNGTDEYNQANSRDYGDDVVNWAGR